MSWTAQMHIGHLEMNKMEKLKRSKSKSGKKREAGMSVLREHNPDREK